MGALYLLRIGEGRGDMIDPIAAEALKGAMTKFGPKGDEGRALASYNAGFGRVNGRSMAEWPAETRQYVTRILAHARGAGV